MAGNPAKVVCTVEEYINKCRVKECLYKAPPVFDKYWDNQKLTRNDIDDFQQTVVAAFEKKNVINGIG